MLLEVKILLFQRYCPFYWGQHIAARITNPKNGKSMKIDFPIGKNNLKQAEQRCCTGVVTLRTEFKGDFKEFYKKYHERFHGDYNCIRKNCAHAVNFMLENFFPFIKQQRSIFRTTYQALFCCSLFTTCGGRYVPTFITTPQGIFNKAVYISKEMNKRRRQQIEPQLLLPKSVNM